MTKREQVIKVIQAQVAKDGKADHVSIRLYCENRISRLSFDRAVAIGELQYRLRRKKENADREV